MTDQLNQFIIPGVLWIGTGICSIAGLKFLKDAFTDDGIPFNPVRENKLFLGVAWILVAITFALFASHWNIPPVHGYTLWKKLHGY